MLGNLQAMINRSGVMLPSIPATVEVGTALNLNNCDGYMVNLTIRSQSPSAVLGFFERALILL